MKSNDFLNKLQHQAQKQAVLHEKRFLPRQLDWIASLIGNYAWQIILLLSFSTAVIIELL